MFKGGFVIIFWVVFIYLLENFIGILDFSNLRFICIGKMFILINKFIVVDDFLEIFNVFKIYF